MESLTTEPLSDSLQDYLEAVCMLVQRDGVARMRDIAAMIGVNKSSTTGAVKALAEKGLVNYDPYQYVTLTDRGDDIGRDLVRRHGVLKRFLMEVLAVPEEEAEAVGCRMEHAIKGDVFDRFVRFLEFAERQSAAGGPWATGMRPVRAGRRRARVRS
jgi:DtxR family transcriptional regulator, Mn-dependent transcriptional regulator